MQLGLGTVQFGLKYGISNKGGPTSEDEVRKILSLAAEKSIRVLDTAAAYGRSEELLGKCVHPKAGFNVFTKTSPITNTVNKADTLRILTEGFETSLKRLRSDSVHGLLIHHAKDLTGPFGGWVWEWLSQRKQEGRVSRIGVSVYEGSEIDTILNRYDVDVVQLPLNVFDQRLISAGHLTRLRQRGVEVHVRSVFLQGLLLMTPEALPDYFSPLIPQLVRWRKLLENKGMTPAQGTIAFLRSIGDAEVALIGIENAAQLSQNIEDFSVDCDLDVDFSEFAIDDDRFLDPRNWRPIG